MSTTCARSPGDGSGVDTYGVRPRLPRPGDGARRASPLERTPRLIPSFGRDQGGRVSSVSRMAAADVVTLQRRAGNAAVAGLLQRQAQPASGATLQSDRFKDSPKLERCFENKDRLREGDPDSDAVTRVQQALLDAQGVTGNTYDLGPTGANGVYGATTAAAVRKFKADEGLGSTQFGDVGPGTMHRLDALFRGGAPPKPQARVPVVSIKPDCGPEAEPGGGGGEETTYSIRVAGDDFTRGAGMIVTFAGDELAHVVPDDKGHFERTITPARRPRGSYDVVAVNPLGQTGPIPQGPEQAHATFNVPCPADPSDPTKLNPELEGVLDQIPIAIEQLMFNHLDGLTRLERDLRGEPEKQSNFGTIALDALEELAERGIELVLNTELTRIIFEVSKQLGADNPDLNKNIKPNVQDLFGELQNFALDKLKKAMQVDDLGIGKDDPKARENALRAFIDGERGGVEGSAERVQEKFVTDKPQLRESRSAPQSPNDDPRVRAAQAYLQGVTVQQADASKQQYDQSAEKWALAEAQAKFGLHTTEDGGSATDLSAGSESGPAFGQEMGLFKIRVLTGPPESLQPQVVRVAVNGMTADTRKQLTDDDIPLASVGARRVLAVTANPVTHVLISKNEAGEVFINTTDADALKWLVAHDAAAEPGTEPTAKGGAISLFDEIESGPQNSLKKAGGLATGGFFI
jgi:hypothetical protein